MEDKIRQEIEYCKQKVQEYNQNRLEAESYSTKRYYEGMADAMQWMQDRLNDLLQPKQKCSRTNCNSEALFNGRCVYHAIHGR